MCVCVVFSVIGFAFALCFRLPHWGRNDWCEILDEALVKPKAERVAPHDIYCILFLRFVRILLKKPLGSAGKWSGSRAGERVRYANQGFQMRFAKLQPMVEPMAALPHVAFGWAPTVWCSYLAMTTPWHRESNACFGFDLTTKCGPRYRAIPGGPKLV